MDNKIEEAKSGRSRCNSCGKSIDKGELRLGIGEPGYDDEIMYKWHHLKCAAEKKIDGLLKAMNEYKGEIKEKSDLEKLINNG